MYIIPVYMNITTDSGIREFWLTEWTMVYEGKKEEFKMILPF